ncbi:hypothetical protein C8R43DRAFT_1179692 [Mycena crocata]|nr:hypothetical protein C8R43DRAFT_1179692 [Mycena crocata]
MLKLYFLGLPPPLLGYTFPLTSLRLHIPHGILVEFREMLVNKRASRLGHLLSGPCPPDGTPGTPPRERSWGPSPAYLMNPTVNWHNASFWPLGRENPCRNFQIGTSTNAIYTPIRGLVSLKQNIDQISFPGARIVLLVLPWELKTVTWALSTPLDLNIQRHLNQDELGGMKQTEIFPPFPSSQLYKIQHSAQFKLRQAAVDRPDHPETLRGEYNIAGCEVMEASDFKAVRRRISSGIREREILASDKGLHGLIDITWTKLADRDLPAS